LVFRLRREGSLWLLLLQLKGEIGMSLESLIQQLEKSFTFKGKTMNYFDLKKFETVKTYIDTDKYERKLKKDEDGNLYLFEYTEEMGFPDDKMDETFVPVESEEESDRLNMSRDITSGRSYIYVGPGFVIRTRD
jgi:hypothetical protein